MDARLTLTLENDDPVRTIITDVDCNPVYTVTTEENEKNSKVVVRTSIKNAALDDIATLEWHGLRGDRFSFKGETELRPVASWLKRKKIGKSRFISFTDDAGREYNWQIVDPTRHHSPLILYAGTSLGEPIAMFHPSTSKPNQSRIKPFITCTSEAKEIQDKVILSFLFVEKSRRFKGNLTQGTFMDRVLLGIASSLVSSGPSGQPL